jgi:hypothetical protein
VLVRFDVRSLGWKVLTDISKYNYGLVPISGYQDRFLAMERRLDLKTELRLIKSLAGSNDGSGSDQVAEKGESWGSVV